MVVEAGIPDRVVSVFYRGWAEVDVRRGNLLDERTQGVGLREPRDLVAELEVLENVLYVGREAVEVGLEVGPELLPARAGPEVAQGELRGVVEGLTRRLPEGRVLLDDAGLVEHRLHLEHVRLTVHQHRVQPAQHRHRQDDVPVLAAHVEVSEDVVGDPPDVVRDPVQVAVTHMRMIGPGRPRRDVKGGVKRPRWRRKTRPSGSGSKFLTAAWRGETAGSRSGRVLAGFLAVFEARAVAVQLEDVDVMGQPVEPRASQPFGAEDLGPFVEGQIRGHARRGLLVALGEDLEQQLGAGLRQRDVAELVHDQYILRDELLLHAQQALVIPGLEQVVHQRGGGGEAHPRAFLTGRQPQRQRQMRLARAGVAQRQHVLSPVEIR